MIEELGIIWVVAKVEVTEEGHRNAAGNLHRDGGLRDRAESQLHETSAEDQCRYTVDPFVVFYRDIEGLQLFPRDFEQVLRESEKVRRG
jgi:hypothetical protein